MRRLSLLVLLAGLPFALSPFPAMAMEEKAPCSSPIRSVEDLLAAYKSSRNPGDLVPRLEQMTDPSTIEDVYRVLTISKDAVLHTGTVEKFRLLLNVVRKLKGLEPDNTPSQASVRFAALMQQPLPPQAENFGYWIKPWDRSNTFTVSLRDPSNPSLGALHSVTYTTAGPKLGAILQKAPRKR